MPGEEMVFKIKADWLKSLGHPSRLAVLEYLKRKEASVNEMAGKIGIAQSSLSKHLSILRQAGILSSRQEKATVYYFVRDKDTFAVLRKISEILVKRFREGETMLKHLAKS